MHLILKCGVLVVDPLILWLMGLPLPSIATLGKDQNSK